jgi:hypothetical protein
MSLKSTNLQPSYKTKRLSHKYKKINLSDIFELLFNYNLQPTNQTMLSAFPALLKAEIHLSTCYKLWPALNCTRILASPFGTTG